VGINILNFYDRHLLGALAEPIRKEFNLSDTELGLLGSAFIWIYAIVGVPIGRMADRFSRTKILAAGLLVWSVLTAATAVVTNFWSLLATRLGVGIGEAVAAPAGTSLIGDLFPPHQRARALGLFMLGVPIGAALSFFLFGPIAQWFGWRLAAVTAAAPALILLPALFLIREPRTVPAGHSHGGASIRELLRIRTLWWIIASGALLNFNMYALGSFCPAFLSRVHGLSLRDSGIATGIVYAVGGIAGGVLAGRWGDHRQNSRMQLASMLTLIAAPAAWFGLLFPAGSVVPVVALLALSYAALNTYYALVYSSIQDIVPPDARGITMAIYFLAMYMCGASFGPLLTGSLSDLLARQAAEAAGSGAVTEAFRAVGLQQAMLIVPVLSVGLAIVLYGGSRTIAADVQRKHARMVAA
jgi:MFS family permease